MLNRIAIHFSSGLKRIRDNHQLWYTILVAIVIFSSFFFIADRFINIAKDAQERLINVRAGSIQDAFVVFVSDEINNPDFIVPKIEQIVSSNETIQEFRVIAATSSGNYIILASLNQEEIGEEIPSGVLIHDLAEKDPYNSFTIEEREAGERFFRTARAIVDGSGRVVGLVSTRQTLSEADKQIDIAIRNSLLIFVLIVAALILLFFRYARIIDYATLYKRLKEIDQLKDDFIAMASHELRSPLASIRGYIELITDAKGLNSEQQKYAGRVDASAKQLNELVEDMLDVSRIEQGRMQFEYTNFNLKELITEVIEVFQLEAKKKGLVLSSGGSQNITPYADKKKIRQVMINLVSNAVKYTARGEVNVTFKVDKRSIKIRVSDTGIGVSREEEEKLFQKFHRIESAKTNEIKGTGLGLWLSREIMRRMKGDIVIESIQGVGTHFIVTLPIRGKQNE